jgi:P pilus assembly chaperone PapD
MKQVKLILLMAVMVAATAGFVHAGISVTPDRHIVSVSPGEQKTVMYHINNSGDEDIDIVIEPKAWSGIKDPYQWLSLESDDVYAKAGESTPLIVNLNVPEDAEGEMVAMLFLCYKENMASQLNIRNGVPLYMVVEGTQNYGLDIKDIDISYARKGDFMDLNFMVKINNTGNVHIVPDVNIIVKNDKERILNTMSLERPNIVLREKDQTYRLGWREPGLRDGIYTAEVALDYDDKIAPQSKDIKFQVTGGRIEKIETEKAGD